MLEANKKEAGESLNSAGPTPNPIAATLSPPPSQIKVWMQHAIVFRPEKKIFLCKRCGYETDLEGTAEKVIAEAEKKAVILPDVKPIWELNAYQDGDHYTTKEPQTRFVVQCLNTKTN